MCNQCDKANTLQGLVDALRREYDGPLVKVPREVVTTAKECIKQLLGVAEELFIDLDVSDLKLKQELIVRKEQLDNQHPELCESFGMQWVRVGFAQLTPEDFPQ